MADEMPIMRHWCHMCSQVVNPIIEAEPKCSICLSGFVEEIDSTNAISRGLGESNLATDRALSLWAPILLGIIGNPRRRQRLHVLNDDHDEGNHIDNNIIRGRSRGMDVELDRELDSIIQRRRRTSTTILQLLQGIRAGMVTDTENHSRNISAEERERFIFINPFHQTIIVQGSASFNESRNHNQNHNTFGSFGDYLIGPGLDMLLQHLADNDPNRYGTPPAQKEVIEALPIVKVKESLRCSVCLDDFDLGGEAKEMPCKHKFHTICLLPWLELHSSCPVCRFQLPASEPKCAFEGSRNSINVDESRSIIGSGERGERVYRSDNDNRRVALPWPFSTLLSSFESSTTSRDSSLMPSTSSSSPSSVGEARAASQTDES